MGARGPPPAVGAGGRSAPGGVDSPWITRDPDDPDDPTAAVLAWGVAPSPFDAGAFVREHGVVLASARGPVPSLAAAADLDAHAARAALGPWVDRPARPRAKQRR